MKTRTTAKKKTSAPKNTKKTSAPKKKSAAPKTSGALVRGKEGREEIYFRHFDTWVDAFAPDGATPAEIARAARYVDALGDDVFARLLAAAAKFRAAYQEAVGDVVEELATPRDVLRHIGPGQLLIEATKEPHVHLELWCDWDHEHGMEWSVRGDTIVYVGPFGDNRPFHAPPRNKWNFADGKGPGARTVARSTSKARRRSPH